MLMKAQVIEQIPNTNLFRVRIPTINGYSGNTSTPDSELPLATLCTLPNVDNVVRAGDIVYVAFEENDYGRPVILGQLYRPQNLYNTYIDIQARSITVKDGNNDDTCIVTLPTKTQIGDITYKKLTDVVSTFDNTSN